MSESLKPKTSRMAARAMSRIFLSPGIYTAEQLHRQLNRSRLNGDPRAFADAMRLLVDRGWIETAADGQLPTFKPTSAFIQRAVEVRMQVTTLPIATQQQYDKAVDAYRQLIVSSEEQKARAHVRFLGEVAILGEQQDLEEDGKLWFPDAPGWEVLATVDAIPGKLCP